MSRLAVLASVGLWVGITVVLAELRWFRRLRLADRLRPFAPAGPPPGRRSGGVRSLGELLGPLATSLGGRLSRTLGINEELGLRLERIHSDLDVAAFRTRQMAWAGGALGVTTLLLMATTPPAPMVLFAIGSAPLLAFLVVERNLARASELHQRKLFLELPVVAEQVGMLLSSGFSLGGAVARTAARGRGAVARDLRRVVNRVRHGVPIETALGEWARVAEVEAVHQLVRVFALHDEAADLGPLIAQEARAIRRATQRELIETIERRNQQVWIPVTVATLVPGVIFLAVPFMDAMSGFTGL
ncbi:MAG TPA: hypothetical protein ENI86_08305 [Acidimicrobiales bacterium]|nr:hypothetical protein [Acidimicrobiales bacterium]